MTSAPDSPLEKKDPAADLDLTVDERVARLEQLVQNSFNYLGRGLNEVDLKAADRVKELESELSKTLTLMNMSTLQNIITLRELLALLIKNETVDAASFEKAVTDELTKAIEAQQKAILDQQGIKVDEESSSEMA